MQFRSLRIAGFKSFVEPAELEILPGLTGIVGPNGCGKSNIVEALRWVMGETSARRMRGGEMDDVIFSGTSARPARNIAEVVLTVTNDGGPVPAIFDKFEEIEVRRRIERGAGSDYRVNGRPVRARDVQLLFADAAIGASSPAMVSQGRISALIAAKPSERRFILEDAAGIAGLQSRRHEAELKLKAAESNLEQLARVLEALRGQEAGLKRQARQAEKYRQAAERIRETEALLLHCAWTETIARNSQMQATLEKAETDVRTAMAGAASCAIGESTAEAAIVTLRQAAEEAQRGARTLVQRQHTLEDERRRIETTRAEATRQIDQAKADLAQETAEQAETDKALAALEREGGALRQSEPVAATMVQLAETAESESRISVASAENGALAARSAAAEAQAQEAAIRRQLHEREGHVVKTQRALTMANQAIEQLDIADTGALAGLMIEAGRAHTSLQAAQAAIEPAALQRAALEKALTEARDHAETSRGAELRLRAEIAGIEAGLSATVNTASPSSALQQIAADPGYEAALAAALGDDSRAGLDGAATWRWVELPPNVQPPEGTAALAGFVKVPPALRRVLGGIGIAARPDAIRLQAELRPGQAIVTREGALFRWDGLVREAGHTVADPVAATLAQGNRLIELRTQLKNAEAAAVQAGARLTHCRQQAFEAQQRERGALDTASTALKVSQRCEAAVAEARNRAERDARQEQQVRNALVLAERDAESAREGLARLEQERSVLPDLSVICSAREAAANDLTKARTEANAAAASLAAARRAHDAIIARLAAIVREAAAWQSRHVSRQQRLAELSRRIDDAASGLSASGERPQAIARELATLMAAVVDAEQAARVGSDALIRAETDLAERRRLAREAEKLLASAREERVRAEAAAASAAQAVGEIQARIAERLNVSAEALAETVAFDNHQPDRTQLEARLAALTRERDSIGPVNLRAEIELQETTSEIARIGSESAELAEAIARLRQAIAKLNREARERLSTAFEIVRVHFKRLFATLFGGGEAELALTDLEDPLEAGLEVFASPPGKKLQILSLLSGGEQALTALALLFAMFLTTPAPVCVLDEVDAPLDDANVTRFCDLLDEISAETRTRFLVITHHRVTMARMDRLYGVTMGERGVSMLVSVDLRQAELFAGYEQDKAIPRRASA